LGTTAAGTAALGNSQGVRVASGASRNTIGTFANGAGAGNLISGNRGEGVAITDVGTTFNAVRGNYVGTTAAGTAALGNNSHGAWPALGTRWTDVGGPAPGTGNVISGNVAAAISLSATVGNRLWGNYVGTTAAGTAALGNFDGVSVAEGANGNLIG